MLVFLKKHAMHQSASRAKIKNEIGLFYLDSFGTVERFKFADSGEKKKEIRVRVFGKK